MCIRDSIYVHAEKDQNIVVGNDKSETTLVNELSAVYHDERIAIGINHTEAVGTVSYTHLRAHETVLDLVCRLLLENKKTHKKKKKNTTNTQCRGIKILYAETDRYLIMRVHTTDSWSHQLSHQL